jgi:hypothetical protein
MARLTISEAARRVGVSRVTLHRYIKLGKLRQLADGTVDTADLTAAGLSLHLETVSERNTVQAPVTPTLHPVTAAPVTPEPDYRERYIALLEQEVERLHREVDRLQEDARRREQQVQERETALLQMLQARETVLLQPGSRQPRADRHALRRRIVELLETSPAGLHHTAIARQLGATCNGLQSKWLRTAITAFLGPDYLPLSISPGPDYLPLRLQSTVWDCNQRWWDHIICNSTPSPFSVRPSWR